MMSPSFFQIVLLGLLQGAAELLPVSSSAHVIVAEKLMRLDPASPQMTFLLVMLHTGTMLAVIVYFWKAWKESYFSTVARFGIVLANTLAATALTGLIGYGLKVVIEKLFLRHALHAEIEQLFGSLPLIAIALTVAGMLILVSGFAGKEKTRGGDVGLGTACWMGIVQGFCIPFRGLSRSGATISTGILLGSKKQRVEEFSFALGVVITPVVLAFELHRLIKAGAEAGTEAPPVASLHFTSLIQPGVIGLTCSFLAGLVALRLLSRFLEKGRWHYFGYYCLIAAAAVALVARLGY